MFDGMSIEVGVASLVAAGLVAGWAALTWRYPHRLFRGGALLKSAVLQRALDDQQAVQLAARINATVLSLFAVVAAGAGLVIVLRAG